MFIQFHGAILGYLLRVATNVITTSVITVLFTSAQTVEFKEIDCDQ